VIAAPARAALTVQSSAVRRTTLTLLSTLMLLAPRAQAQDSTLTVHPIGRFAADVRATFPKFKQDAAIADTLDVTTANLPGRTLGLAAGAHVYPVRFKGLTLGFGGEWTVAHASHTAEPAKTGLPAGPTVNSRFSALSPQVSFNFGSRDGWSYISGGIGWSKYTVENAAAPQPDPESSTKTINYGGGARWYAKPHVAFCFDLRFYAINPQLATPARPAYPRLTMAVMSAGLAFK
jgi:hypothetical protein